MMNTRVYKSKTKRRTHQIVLHYLRLSVRILFTLTVAFYYCSARVTNDARLFGRLTDAPAFFYGLFAWFFFEMILFRILPTKLDSLGSRKQRRSHYLPIEGAEIPKRRQLSKGVVSVAAVWIAFNTLLGVLCLFGIFDEGLLFLVFLAYSICDSVCILFFCPIRRWFLKNRCCTSCRIYNWDYAMMCTPLLFLPHPLTYLISAVALYILVDWEIAFFRHPERFALSCNDALQCKNCTERLCTHSRELAAYLKTYAKRVKGAERSVTHTSSPHNEA